jgi:hypothetical protein
LLEDFETVVLVNVCAAHKASALFGKPEAERPADSVGAAGHNHHFSLNLHAGNDTCFPTNLQTWPGVGLAFMQASY